MKILGVDVGGTYTDLIYVDEESQETRLAKVPTREEQSEGIMQGLVALEMRAQEADAFVHGTTVATNAVIERRGAKCGLITTRGFRDIVELRRRERISIWGLTGWFEPLVSRDMRLEVDERTLADGSVLIPVSGPEVEKAAQTLLAQGAEAIVISFLHSYANPDNELAAKEAVQSVWPNDYIVAGHELVGEFREFERTSTAVLNAYVQPRLSRYLSSLVAKLNDSGFNKEVLIVQSNGGVMSADVARQFSVHTITSGPAAGVIAASHIGNVAGSSNIISMDMGGTSLDIALVREGQKPMATNQEVEFGLPIAVPMLDVRSVGAGGGSVAWIDDSGLLEIGPMSAGADPGPACYGRGGSLPTVTDAHVCLAWINPDKPIGQELVALDQQLATEAIKKHVAEPLGLDVMEAAEAIHHVASLKTAGSIRAISVERGYDPREFSLVAFGGAGPLHAATVMRELSVEKAIIPYYPGITSALGCLFADVQHDFVSTVHRRLEEIDPAEIKRILQEQMQAGHQLIESQDLSLEDVHVFLEADMRYEGQIHTIKSALPSPDVSREQLAAIFAEDYRRKYKLLLEGIPPVLVNLRTRVVGTRPRTDLRALVRDRAESLETAKLGERTVIWKREPLQTEVFDRLGIPKGTVLEGPCIVEQPDTTIAVEPGTKLASDAYGNLIMELI